jgi:putative transposase
VDYLRTTFQVSLGRACDVMDLSRSVYYYQSKKDDDAVIDKLQSLAEKRPTEGFWKMYFRIRKEGLLWNHKRIHRVYKLLKLNMKRKGKRRLPARILQPLEVVSRINVGWSMDFMNDSLVSGRKFRVLNLLDDFNREALAIEVDTSLRAERVIRVLNQVIQWRGVSHNESGLIMAQNSFQANSAFGVKNRVFICNLFNQESLHRMHT